jgi:hypothetical protein
MSNQLVEENVDAKSRTERSLYCEKKEEAEAEAEEEEEEEGTFMAKRGRSSVGASPPVHLPSRKAR